MKEYLVGVSAWNNEAMDIFQKKGVQIVNVIGNETIVCLMDEKKVPIIKALPFVMNVEISKKSTTQA